jgi:hypothetical protein
MADFTALHKKAMDLAEKAVVAKVKNEQPKSKAFFQEAYEAEREAAFAYADKNSTEPTRSVLFRSAAALALNAELYREAEQMACIGISGTAPIEILEELRDILEDVNFGRHLTRGEVLKIRKQLLKRLQSADGDLGDSAILRSRRSRRSRRFGEKVLQILLKNSRKLLKR